MPNGVVVLEGRSALPEGAAVSVTYPALPQGKPATQKTAHPGPPGPDRPTRQDAADRRTHRGDPRRGRGGSPRLAPGSRFFFQAEAGIRRGHVTGVQTCALPICTTNGPADLAAMRTKLDALHFGEPSLQGYVDKTTAECAASPPSCVLIRLPEQPGGDAAQQQVVQKVREALGRGVEYRRTEVVGPSVGS